MLKRSLRTSLTVIGALLLLAIVVITCWAIFQGVARLASISSQVVPEQVDASWMLEEFSLPADLTLVSLWRSSDTPGWYGRQELRMVGDFRFTPAQLADFQGSASDSGWYPGPLPAWVAGFPKPPEELPALVGGLSYCTVTYFGTWEGDTWHAGGSMDTSVDVNCFDYPDEIATYGETFDHYRVGVIDLETGQVELVFQNYY